MTQRLYTVFTALLILIPTLAFSQESKPVDSLSLDSGYFQNQPSDNYTFKLFAMEAQKGLNRLLEEGHEKFLKDSSKLGRGVYLLLGGYLSKEKFFKSAYHEWGHFSRDRALGGTTSTIYSGDYSGAPGVKGEYTSFFPWAIKDLTSFGSNAAVIASSSSSYSGNPEGGSAPTALFFGGGLNNDSYLADQFDEDFFLTDRPALFNFWWHLDRCRLAIANYSMPGGDIDSTLREYRQTGTTYMDTNQVKMLNNFSLLSGNTIALFQGIIQYFGNGNTHYQPFMIGNFLVPNQTNYFSSRGFTRKFQSGYVWNEFFKLLFGIEYVELGKRFVEANFGAQYKKDQWRLLAKLTMLNTGYYNNLELAAWREFSQNFKVGAYLAKWDSRSLLGERNSLRLSENTTMQGGVRLSLIY